MTEKLKNWASGDPERRKQGWHDEVLDELNRHADRIETRLRRFFARALIAFAVIGFSSALALAGYGYLLRQQHKTTNQIQAQRRESIMRACTEQNVRHNATLKVIDQLLDDAAKKNPKQKKVLAEARTQNMLLINALTPLQNCKKLVKASLNGGS